MSTKLVEIYSTPTCHFCHLAKEWFDQKGIKYIEHDVASDVNKRQEMVEITGQRGVPVIKIVNDVIIGFNQPKLAELLDITD